MHVFLQSYLECTIDTKSSAYLTVLLTDMIHSDATQKHVSINTRMVGYHRSHSTCAYTRLYMYMHVHVPCTMYMYMQHSVCIYTCICIYIHVHVHVLYLSLQDILSELSDLPPAVTAVISSTHVCIYCICVHLQHGILHVHVCTCTCTCIHISL